ncbi:ABC transporter permease [Paenibacillus contaminans]|uniref:ABC transporter permease n=1 Tax=Paenibacillus contaminans TaxID=450362 RepID=A0A329MIC1_9BACL|nr:ABC transporter permease [Paenibacillus contaminans]RAV19318.1 hypothetical protein DQG23_20175 [Paenibacillus contaminans]
MGTFVRILRSEWLKLRKSNIWLLIFVSPALASLVGFVSQSEAGKGEEWLLLFSYMGVTHALLFLPLLTGVFAAFICRYEHGGGGWKQVLALPISRTQLFVAKLTLVVALLAVSQLLFGAGLLAIGSFKGFASPVPWAILLRGLLGGLVATLPLAALQLSVSIAWASFAAPLALNVIFTLPNMLVANSATYGPYYPWAQPMLAMLPSSEDSFGAFNVSFETLLFVICGSFALFFVSGLAYFRRKEI